MAERPVCVVTGGSSGIGLATAKRFAQAGHNLFICGRNLERLEAARSAIASSCPIECKAVALDVGDRAQARRLIDEAHRHFGRIDILINNAGRAQLASVTQMTIEDFYASLAINVEAVFHTTQAVWDILQNEGGGTIINVSSMSAFDPFQGFSVYGACKAWVNLYTQAIAAEGKAVGIRAFAICPGAVDTPLLRRLFPDYPIDQTLSPDEIARQIEHLCLESSSVPSGSAIPMRK